MAAMQMTIVGASAVAPSTDITIGTPTSYNSTTDASSYTSTGLGAVGSSERAIVAVYGRSAGTPTISSVTIGGQAMTQIATLVSSGSRVALFIGPVGVTGQVTVNWSATVNRCGIVHWPVGNIQSDTPTGTDTSISDPAAGSLNCSAGGAIFGVCANASAGTYTWGGITEAADFQFETNTMAAAASGFASAQTALSVSADFSGTPASQAACFAAIR